MARRVGPSCSRVWSAVASSRQSSKVFALPSQTHLQSVSAAPAGQVRQGAVAWAAVHLLPITICAAPLCAGQSCHSEQGASAPGPGTVAMMAA